MTTLDVGGMPRHRQLYLVLRDQITNSGLGPGDPLPSEHALGELHGVSRITVRRALQDLSDDGYVTRRHGRGTFVAAAPHPPSGPEPQTVMGALRQVQLDTTVEVLEVDRRRPSALVARALGIDPTTEAVHVLRLRSHDREPLMITDAWLPIRFAAHITAKALRKRALYELLEGAGVTLGRVSQEVTAEIADPVRGRLLQVDIGSALLRINRLVHDIDGEPIQYLTIWTTPRRSRILTDVPAHEIDTAASGVLAHDVPRDGRLVWPMAAVGPS